MQHHGTTNGIGFTIDYKDEISPLAKVIIVAESYTEQYLTARQSGSMDNKHESIVDVLEGKFKKHTYRKIIATLESLVI